jgi:hypothetical protein
VDTGDVDALALVLHSIEHAIQAERDSRLSREADNAEILSRRRAIIGK